MKDGDLARGVKLTPLIRWAPLEPLIPNRVKRLKSSLSTKWIYTRHEALIEENLRMFGTSSMTLSFSFINFAGFVGK